MRIAFCVIGVNDHIVRRTEFYRQDFELLQELGHDVRLVKSPLGLRASDDVAFVWWWNYLSAWGPAAKMLRLPIVVTGVYNLGAQHVSRWKRAVKSFGARWADVNIFVSELERNRVSAAIGSVRHPMFAPLVVDTAVYLPAPESGVRRPGEILNISWQRRTNMQRKMLPELVRAFAFVQRTVPEARLTLAGPPEDGQADLRALASELGVADAVRFPGEIDRTTKVRLMQQCAVYVQVSRFEGFGLAVAEALACGATVLVADRGAVREVVGDQAAYVRDLSVSAIADGIVDCLRGFPSREAEQARHQYVHERLGRAVRARRLQTALDLATKVVDARQAIA
ncbi:MAG: glycosyltransferase [Luteitalea sp.]|nr:glycosyltransferase [Luteitalea sp.]